MAHKTSFNSSASWNYTAIGFRHFYYAVAAADYGSFRRAAGALKIREATLAQRIRELEHAMGMPIFGRYSGGVRTTPFGDSFLRAVRGILEQVDGLVTSAQMTRRGESGRLSIGFYTSLSAGNFRAALVEYTQQFLQVEIEMVERSRNRLSTALRNGSIDAAIVTGERALCGSSSLPLWSERLLLVLHRNHRMANKPVVSWTDLVDEVLLLGRRDPGPAIQEYLFAKLVSPEDRPRIVWQDVSRESIKSLVGAQLGIGLTLEASLGTKWDDIVHREIRDGCGPARIGFSVNWQEDNENPALANFLDLLRRRYPSSL